MTKYRVACQNCGLDHIWQTKFEAEKEKKKHTYLTGHAIKIELLA